MEAIFRTVDGLSQDEVKQLYDYLIEYRLRSSSGDDRAPGPARTGDDFSYEWSGEFWENED